MDDLSKHYQLLGLKPGASPEEMKQAYRDMVKVWHPDRFAHDARLRALSQDKLKEINGAYELLKAQAFEASIKPEPAAAPGPEPAAAVPSSLQSRTAPRVTLGILASVLVAAAAFLFLRKDSGKHAAASAETNAVVAVTSPPRPEAAGYSLSFNGNHSHFSIATKGSLSGTFTVEFWALTRQARSGGTILSSRAPDECGFDIKFREGKRFHADIGDGSHWLVRNANATYAYQAGIWYHLAYVVTTNSYRVYINGMMAGGGEILPAGNSLLYDDSHHLCFGLERMDADDLDGCLAEIRIWKTARTQTEIESGMNRTLTGNEPGLMGYWRFAEGSGTEVRDGSGHGFTGKLIGDVSWSTDSPPAFHR